MCTLHARTMSQSGMTTADIDPTLCPYLRIKFVEWLNDALDVDRRVSDIYPWLWDTKAKNPSIKIVLTFYNIVGDDKFYEMYRTPERRLKFIPLLVTYVRNNKFDGVELDLDMGFGLRSPERYHIDRWADFVEDVQKALVDEATRSGKPKIVLFGRIDERAEYLYPFYNVPRMYRHSDLINLEAWASYSQRVGPRFNISLTSTHHCKIYKTNENDKNCIEYYVNSVMAKGGIKEKTILSLYLMATFFYEYKYNLDPTILPNYDRIQFNNYGEVCEYKKGRSNVTRVYEQCPIAMVGRNVIYYDDEISMAEKIKYVKKNGLAGFELLDMSADDFSGNCGKGKFPLMRTVLEECRKP
nr:chitinase-3-like protein 1 [Biomphalaria glabrata]